MTDEHKKKVNSMIKSASWDAGLSKWVVSMDLGGRTEEACARKLEEARSIAYTRITNWLLFEDCHD